MSRLARYFLLMIVCSALFLSKVNAQQSAVEQAGTLDDARPFIEYPLVIDEANPTLNVEMQVQSGDLDALLYLVDDQGVILNDNDGLTPEDQGAILHIRHLTPGDYTLVATRTDVAEGTTSGDFTLQIEIGPMPNDVLTYDVSDARLAEVGYPSQAPAERADWTILVFYAGDNNLEGSILNDLDEFELAGGSDQQNRIIALVDRSPEFDASNGDWSDVHLYEVQRDETGDHSLEDGGSTIDTVPLADLGELDTGDGETFAQFLTWGIRSYPAQHYAVAIGSHGAGWLGLGIDDSSVETGRHYDIISLPEFRAALETAKQATGGTHFDLLINDACLMSSVEYYAVADDYFNVSIASPEIVVNPALDMTLLGDGLKAAADVDLDNLGKTLVDQYIQHDIFSIVESGTEYYASATTNLTRFDPVVEAVEQFAAVVNRDPGFYVETLGRARSNTYTYTAFLDDTWFIDVGHFMEQVIVGSTDVDLISAAQRVLQALQDARIYAEGGETVARWVYYYNIFFSESYDDNMQRYVDETTLPEWGRMLQAYYGLTARRTWRVDDSVYVYHPPAAPVVNVTQVYPSVASPSNPPTIQMEVVGHNISRGSFTVDQMIDGRPVRMMDVPILTEVVIGNTVNQVNQWRSGVDQSTFSWLPTTLSVVTDGTTSAVELLRKSGTVGVLEGAYHQTADDPWNDVAVMFSLETGGVARVISRAPGSGALADVSIPPGSEFAAYRTYVGNNGQVRLRPGTIYVWGDDGLTWSEQPAPPGDYQLGFSVQSYGGLVGFASVPVTIEAAETESPGYTDLDLGLNFRYPAGWIVPFDTGSQIVTGSPDNTQNYSIAHFTEAFDSPWKVAEDYQAKYGLTPGADGVEMDLLGHDAVEFEYSYTLDDALWHGKALAIYTVTPASPDGTGLVFAAESQNEANLDSRYADLVEGLTLFDANTLAAESTRQWGYRLMPTGDAYPVPLNWQEATSDGWTTYTSPDYPAAFARVAAFADGDPTVVFDQINTQIGASAYHELVYRSGNKSWQVAEYSLDRDGTPVMGRLYVTRIDTRVYALWFETANDEGAVVVMRGVFEPMVDGFAPQSTVQYALGGLNPTLLKAVMTRATQACQTLSPNDICYGEGDLTATGSSGAIEDFDSPGDVVQVTSVEDVGVGVQVDRADTFDAFSIGVIETDAPNQTTDTAQADTQDLGDERGVRLGVFGGLFVTRNNSDNE